MFFFIKRFLFFLILNSCLIPVGNLPVGFGPALLKSVVDSKVEIKRILKASKGKISLLLQKFDDSDHLDIVCWKNEFEQIQNICSLEDGFEFKMIELAIDLSFFLQDYMNGLWKAFRCRSGDKLMEGRKFRFVLDKSFSYYDVARIKYWFSISTFCFIEFVFSYMDLFGKGQFSICDFFVVFCKICKPYLKKYHYFAWCNLLKKKVYDIFSKKLLGFGFERALDIKKHSYQIEKCFFELLDPSKCSLNFLVHKWFILHKSFSKKV